MPYEVSLYDFIRSIEDRIHSAMSEEEFITDFLVPLFVALGPEAVTLLRAWECREYRCLIFPDVAKIAAHRFKLDVAVDPPEASAPMSILAAKLPPLGLIRDEGGRCVVRNPTCEETICFEEADILEQEEYYERKLQGIRPGRKDADIYEQCVFEMLCRSFAGQLTHPERQSRTATGNQRRDIMFFNVSPHPFWQLVSREHSATNIVFECKNTDSLRLENVGQLADYLGPLSGDFGVIVSRKPPSESIKTRARVSFSRSKKVVLFLCDDDLIEMARLHAQEKDPTRVIERKYVQFTRKLE
jgi:hypothetical protein